MISDEKRREVAKRLRGLDATITNRNTLEQAVDKLMKAVCGDIPFSPIRYSVRNLCGLAASLADLIDRPTCDVRMGVTGHIGVCTRCGAMVEMRAAVFDAIEALPTRYCPNCGAEVIPHAERRD